LRAFSLKSNGRDESLDLGGLGADLGVLLVGSELASDDVRSDIVLLVEVEELSNLVGSLGSKSSVNDGVGEAGDFVVTLSDNNGGKNAHIVVNNATSNTLSLPLTLATGSVSAHALLQQESNTSMMKDTLLHTETLFVFTSSDSEHVALPLIAKRFGADLVRDSLLKKVANLVLIVDFDGFLLARGRVGDVDFHAVWGIFFVSFLSVSST